MKLARAVPILTVANVEAAVNSYSAALGLDVLMNHGWIATLGNDGSVPQFSVMERDQTAPVNPVASIEVEDVDRAYQRVVDLGLEIVHPLTNEDWGARRFFFRDEDGNVVNVLSHLG